MVALAKVPPPGETLGLGRRETIYDTDVHADGAALGNCEFFANFNTFNGAGGAAIKKTKGRDTNLKGAAAFLPTGYKFGAYRWRLRLHSIDVDECASIARSVHFAEVRRARNMGFCVLYNDQTPYITAQTNDLISWADNERLVPMVTTQTAAGPGVATLVPTSGNNHEGRVLDVNGQPFVLTALERWTGEENIPQAAAGANFSPTDPIYSTMSLDGVLIRPSN